MKHLKEPGQRVWDTNNVLKHREMHRLEAENARTPGLNEPGRREAGSAMQAYYMVWGIQEYS